MGYNIVSILLGLAAWLVPLWAIVRRPPSAAPYVLASLGACGGALWAQLGEVSRRAQLSDWSALMDTAGAVQQVAAALLVVTLLLNGVAWLRTRKA